jgi:hypothetical protein
MDIPEAEEEIDGVVIAEVVIAEDEAWFLLKGPIEKKRLISLYRIKDRKRGREKTREKGVQESTRKQKTY